MFAPRWSVWQLTRYIRHKLTSDEELAEVWVEGEVSGVYLSAPGHLYFTLQDSQAALKCVMWAPRASRSAKRQAGKASQPRYLPKEGAQVVAQGAITVYEKAGQYQLNVKSLSPLGAGERAAALEQLKARLAGEGLFDVEHKKTLPPYPQHLSLVTSPRGAAVQDLIKVLGRRWPLAGITVVPTLVQGVEAGPAIAAAVGRADALGADLLIVGRGGGSPEDLWGFNTEAVARALFACSTPVISAVGHETDFTLADMVADLRAPTPSAAAELAVPEAGEVAGMLAGWEQRLTATMASRLQSRAQALDGLRLRLNQAHPHQRLATGRQGLASLAGRLTIALATRLEVHRRRVARAAAALEALSPLAVLARGYGLVLDDRGRPRSRAAAFAPGDGLEVLMADGALRGSVEKVKLKPSDPLSEEANHAPTAS